MPSDSGQGVSIHSSSDYPLTELIRDIENDRETGCIKYSNERLLGRGAMLLYRGRIAGCISLSKENPVPQSTQPSAAKMLQDLAQADTVFTRFPLPDNIVRPFAALFIGKEVQSEDPTSSPVQYFEKIRKFMESRSKTGCIVLMTENPGTKMFFFDNGTYAGFYDVEQQIIDSEIEAAREFLNTAKINSVDASVLVAEPDDTFGFSFTSVLEQ